MLKKRLIFTLLYSEGQVMLSRNFRLQKIGDLNWLKNNYNFSKISFSIDELIILNVKRGEKNINEFCEVIKIISEGCFVPVAAGGGVTSVEVARKLLRSGADKIVINSEISKNKNILKELSSEFGKQCIVASIDLRKNIDNNYIICSDSGTAFLPYHASEWISDLCQRNIGELYLNSIDRDGTGQGYDFNILNLLPIDNNTPVILAGGVGNALHLATGLEDNRVDAVATANLLNFVGDGLIKARASLIGRGINLPIWNSF
jgi:cyclase